MPVCLKSPVGAALALTAVLAAGAACLSAATAAQATPAAPQTRPETAALAWALGTNLGLAAAVQRIGSAPAIVKDKLATSDGIARALGTTVPAMPERGDQDRAAYGARILHYMLKDVAPIASHLAEKHSARHALLFELAIKSATIAFMYGPGESTGLSIAQVIEDRGRRSDLPAELWKPLVDSVRGKESYDAVKGKLLEMHTAVALHLATTRTNH
jgi:hypothetical protein